MVDTSGLQRAAMGWLVHARLGVGMLQRTSCVSLTTPAQEPLIAPEGSHRGCRVHSELWRPGCAHRVVQAGAKWVQMNEDHQHQGEIPCHLAWKGLLIERVTNGEGTKPKGHVCELLLICNQGWGGFWGLQGPKAWEICNPANFQGQPSQ